MKLSVVGLGYEKDHVTLQGLEEIKSADVVVLKTALTKTALTLTDRQIDFVSCDSLYDEAQDFSALDENIYQFLKSQKGKVVFCVNGSGTDDGTVQYLKDKCQLKIFPGVAQSQKALSVCPQSKFQYFCATELIESDALSTNVPLVVTEIDDKYLASAVKEKLAKFFDEEEDVVLCNGCRVKNIALYELDQQRSYDERTSLLIQTKPLTQKKSFEVADLKEILRVLRSENGCPWDKVQTHESLRANVLEEAYELVDAIDSGDIDNMIEETGDNILQPYFHVSLAEEDGEFDEKEVIATLCKKLIFRHSHVFGLDKATNAEDALSVWEKNKAIEKGTSSVTDSMHKVAKGLPSLTRASKVQKRASKNGFDWKEQDGLFDKLLEESNELKQAVACGNNDEVEKEAGDLLFQAVNICRFLGLDAETTLNKAVTKFVNRFEYMESKVLEQYDSFADAPNDVMESFWNEAKQKGL